MAVQAQYPSTVIFPNSNLQGSDKVKTGEVCLEQIQSPTMILFNNNDNEYGINHSNVRIQRKRGRDAFSGITNVPLDSFSGFIPHLQHQQPPQIVDLSQLHNNSNNLRPHQNLLVSTGLKLSSNHHQQRMTSDVIHSSSVLSDHINHQMKQHQDEINQLLLLQGEQLRRALSEKRQRQYRALLTVAEESVLRQLREKQADVEKAVRHNAELGARAAQLSMESQVWQAKAHAQEAAAASLQAQLHQAMINASGGGGADAFQADDAESVYIDPDRVALAQSGSFGPVCKTCRRRPASVVLLPCRHLCVCAACDGVVSACPYCFTMKQSSLEVNLP